MFLTESTALCIALFFISIIILMYRDECLGLAKCLFGVICIVCFIGIARSSFLYGTYVGSYKMMRGKYEILYSFNKDSVPNDTIIKNEYFYSNNGRRH